MALFTRKTFDHTFFKGVVLWEALLFILGAMSFLFLIISIPLFYTWIGDSSLITDWSDFAMIAATVISLTGTSVVLLRRLRQYHQQEYKKPVHPGWRVNWELWLWMILLGVACSCLSMGDLIGWSSPSLDEAMFLSRNCPRGVSYFVDAGDNGHPDDYCPSKVVGLWALQIVTYCIGIIMGCIHFGLFVNACVVCDRYNKEKIIERHFQIGWGLRGSDSDKGTQV